MLALVALMTVGDAAKVSHASKSVLRPTTSERNKMISYENQKMKAQLSSKRQHLRESIKKKHADRKAHNDAAQKKSQLSASKRRLAMGNVKKQHVRNAASAIKEPLLTTKSKREQAMEKNKGQNGVSETLKRRDLSVRRINQMLESEKRRLADHDSGKATLDTTALKKSELKVRTLLSGFERLQKFSNDKNLSWEDRDDHEQLFSVLKQHFEKREKA